MRVTTDTVEIVCARDGIDKKEQRNITTSKQIEEHFKANKTKPSSRGSFQGTLNYGILPVLWYPVYQLFLSLSMSISLL